MWDIIETDFGGDETANFGPRKETGSALYQIDTMATVSCREQDNTVIPKTVSSVLEDLTCLAVDKSLVLKSSSTLGFDSEIDELEWSPDGSVVVVGVSAGILYVLDAGSAQIVFSVTLVPEERRVKGKSFKRILISGSSHLLILTTDGQLIVQSDIDVFKQEAEKIDESIKETICIGDVSSQHSVVNDIIILGDYVYTLGGGDSILSKWSYTSGDIELDDQLENTNDVALVTGRGTTDGHYLFTLDSNHHVHIWDSEMLVCVKQFTDICVADLCLLETNTSPNNSLQDMKLVILTVAEGDQCLLKVQTLPAWDTIYNLQLSAPSLLAKCNTFQDALYITEFCQDDTKPGIVTTVRFRCLNETDPKTRLYRILRNNKFEEAEMFAKMFQLDIELVHEVKTNYLIDQLSPWNVSKYEKERVEDMMSQLWVCLDTIVDDLHTAKECMRAALTTFADTKKLLSYCKQRLMKAANEKDPTILEKQQVLSSKLMQIQHRLVTFKMAYGEEAYTGEKWEQFMKVNLLQQSVSWLDRGVLDTGFIIWTRHQTEWTTKSLSPDLIQQVLSTISYSCPAADVLGYISTGLIPLVMREVPQALNLLVDFTIDKAKNMEMTDKSHWPGSAIQFAEFVYTRLVDATSVVIDDETYMTNDNARKTKLKCEYTIKPLETMIVRLRQLDDVLHKYKCRLSLTQFLQETKETIAFRMLDKVVALELIASTLDRQIQPYMREHNLNQDQIFSKYIKDLLERYGQDKSFSGAASWEAKASCIIDCITDAEQKIAGILEVMKWAPIPWSNGINQLVQMGLKLNHTKVKLLQEQCDRVHIRKIMMKYGLKNTEVPQGREAERLMYFMLHQDKPGCLDDVLEVMESCGVNLKVNIYGFRLRQLIQNDRLEECMDLLRGLPEKLMKKIAYDILILTTVKLNYTVDIPGLEDKIHEDRRLYLEAAIHFTKYLQANTTDTLEIQDLKEQMKTLTNILGAQVEYNQYISLDQYTDVEFRMTLVYKYIKEFFVTKKQDQNASYAKVYRLADIQQISHTTIQGQLAINSANAGDIHRAVQICGELYESSPTDETAQTLSEVAQAFLAIQAEVNTDDVDTNKLRLLPDVCYRLACQAVSICSPDKMSRYLELCKTCSLLLTVSQQCESGGSTLSAQWGESSEVCVDKAWEMFGDLSIDVFQEDAMMLSSVTALPIVSQYALLNPLLSLNNQVEEGGGDEETSPVLALCNGVIPVVEHLRHNSHIQLAFTFSQHMLYTLLQYIQQQDMGLPMYTEGQKEGIEAEKKSVEGMNKTSQAMLKDLIVTLIMKIVNYSKVDDRLALTYMATRPKREVMDVMMRLTKAAGHQYKKLKAIAGLGIALGQILKEPGLISNCQQLETNAAWGYRLNKMKISFKDAILGPNSEKSRLLPTIAQSDSADTQLVKEFCQAFELDEDEGLLLYLDHLFVPVDESGFGTVHNKSGTISRAREAIREIKNVDELISRIRKVYYRTSSYDYETLEFTLDVMMMKASDNGDIPVEKGLKLLEYLKVYTRHSQPGEYEMEYRPGGDKKESQIFMSTLPLESKTRLPLHPLLQGDQWKIITPELKRESIATWLLIAKLLNLSPDQICLVAVQNMVGVYVKTFTSPDGGTDMSHWNWRPDQANHTLLQDASHVLQSIKNCESTLALAKWMVSKLPLGSEKVHVLKKCIRLAELWHQSIPEESAKREKAMAAYRKFVGHWQKMASAQALCTSGLGEPDLLQNTDKPTVLIQKLYEHPSITTQTWDAGATKPDIHGAAEQIAKINNIDLACKQNALVQKWLQTSEAQQQDSETTMTFSLDNLKFAETEAEMDDDEEVNFKRVVHLVTQGNREANVLLLLEFAFKPKEGQDTMSCIRALRCLLYLCDDEILQKTCSKSLQDISHLLHIMIYLSSLEKLHIQHTVDTFQACHKDGLVKGIWKNHSYEKTAVTLVSCLCLDYSIYDQQLWTGILQRLHSFGLLRQLEYVLFRLNKVPELWQVPGFCKMWFTIVSVPLSKVCCPLSLEQTNTCVHYFNVLMSCPVLDDIDIEALSKSYQTLQMPTCALGCLLLARDTYDGSLQTLLSKYGNELLDNTTKLLPSGLNHCIGVKIQALVFSGILVDEKYSDILDTPHQTAFISYCVEHKSIDGLLVFAIQNNRLSEAKALFTVYSSTYPAISMKITSYMEEEEEDSDYTLLMLKAYLEMQSLHGVAVLL